MCVCVCARVQACMHVHDPSSVFSDSATPTSQTPELKSPRIAPLPLSVPLNIRTHLPIQATTLLAVAGLVALYYLLHPAKRVYLLDFYVFRPPNRMRVTHEMMIKGATRGGVRSFPSLILVTEHEESYKL